MLFQTISFRAVLPMGYTDIYQGKLFYRQFIQKENQAISSLIKTQSKSLGKKNPFNNHSHDIFSVSFVPGRHLNLFYDVRNKGL